jgi:hypothetical protein
VKPAHRPTRAVRAEVMNWGLGDTTVDPGEVLLPLVTQSAAQAERYAMLLEETYEAAERLKRSFDAGAAADDAERTVQRPTSEMGGCAGRILHAGRSDFTHRVRHCELCVRLGVAASPARARCRMFIGVRRQLHSRTETLFPVAGIALGYDQWCRMATADVIFRARCTRHSQA